MKQIVFLLFAVFYLSACDTPVTERVGVSVDTNAYYTAFQKSPTTPWTQINYNNAAYEPETLSFTVEELTDSYAAVFVCPSTRRDVSHKVYSYYATAAEMTLLDFTCKKPPGDILQSAMHGTISGVSLATLSNPRGELVHLALSSTQSLVALEAFAAEVPIGKRDVVAMKGLQKIGENIIDTPTQFAIFRGFASLTEKSQRADFGFSRSIAGYAADFNTADEATVTIIGTSANDTLLTEVSFLSRNKSLLNLVSTNQISWKFLPVPLDALTNADLGGFFNINEFQPGEGHELSAIVMTSDGKADREVRKFFTVSETSHTLNIPKKIDSSPTLLLNSVDQLQSIDAAWLEYKDSTSGKTQLYRWTFEGTAGKLTGDDAPDVEITKLQWFVHATPGWLNNATRTVGAYSFSLPVKYDSVVVSNGKKIDVWSDAWSFQSGTPINWEFTAFTTDENGSSGAIIEYLLNRNFVENYRISQAHLRSSISP